MKQVVVVICLALTASVGAAVATAGGAREKAAWTESKAERLVQSGATVRLAAEDRAALMGELRRAVALYQALALEASLSGDGGAVNGSSFYYDLAYRYARALGKVRGGLELDAADCSGSGRAVAGDRFSAFQCRVTSESLEIPSAALVVTENGEIAVEGQPRNVGPIDARLVVRVTGKSSFAFRKV